MSQNCRNCQEREEEIELFKKEIMNYRLTISDLKEENEKLKIENKELLKQLEKEQVRFDEMNKNIKDRQVSDAYISEIKKKNEKLKNEINELKKQKESKHIFKICSACDEKKVIETKTLDYGSGTQIWDSVPNKKNQVFELEKSQTKSGYYLIKSHYTGLYLGMDKTGNFSIAMRRKNENNQNFKFCDFKNSFYMLENENKLTIDLGYWKTNNGNVVDSCAINAGTAQQWKLVLI